MCKDNLEQHVFTLSEKIGARCVSEYYDQLQEAHLYITSQLQNYGYHVDFQSYFVSEGGTGRRDEDPVWEVQNIIATKLGDSAPEEVIVIGAHYDSCCNTPGADDNASGVAGMLELARLIAKVPTRRTIKFVAFVNEEPPYFHTDLMGSAVYAKNAKEQGENIKLAIILEMIGFYSDHQDLPSMLKGIFPDTGNFIMAVADQAAIPMVKDMTRYFDQHSQVSLKTNSGYEHIIRNLPGFDFSDHWAFWQQGYPAVMITDTAFMRNPHYHLPTDKYDTLNYEKMAEVVKGFAEVIKGW